MFEFHEHSRMFNSSLKPEDCFKGKKVEKGWSKGSARIRVGLWKGKIRKWREE